jgi:hypothetical protein
VADGDSPAAPADFHMLIVDKATQIALRANREWKQAQAMQESIDLELNRMLETITPGQPDGPDSYVGVTFASRTGDLMGIRVTFGWRSPQPCYEATRGGEGDRA